jgi:hypothetical protein
MPDVVCDWRGVQLRQDGPDRVAVSGARGRPPTTKYKATATTVDGYRSVTTAMFAGVDAAGRARRAGESLVARVERLLARDGRAPLTETSVEVIGGGDTRGPEHRLDGAPEAVVKIGVRHPEREALQVFASEFAPMSLVAQGMTGIFAGRPRIAPVFRVIHLLVDKADVPVTVELDGEARPVAVAPGAGEAPAPAPPLPPGDERDAAASNGALVTVPLRRLAYGRSGDKGDKANIGLIARRPEYAPLIARQITCERVAACFAHYLSGDVERFELPGLHAINFVLDGVLGGSGGTSSLRYDPQAKSYAAMLLGLPVRVPASWAPAGDAA